MPIALCLEDLHTGRFVQCVAIPGGRPGLGLGPSGQPTWRVANAHHTLWVTADERLALRRAGGAPQCTVRRGGRALDVPEDQPVILLDGDEIGVDSADLRVHVHGPTRRVAPPRPLQRSSPGRLAMGLVAASALIEVRCSPPDPVDTQDYVDDPTVCGSPDPDVLDFGVLELGAEPATLELRLDNMCSDWLTVSGVTVVPEAAPFRVASVVPQEIRPDGDDTVRVVFEPEGVGEWEARLVFSPESDFPEVELIGSMVESEGG